MALDVQNSVASAHRQHSGTFTDSEDEDVDGLMGIYQLTQAEQVPADNELDYGLVSMLTLPGNMPPIYSSMIVPETTVGAFWQCKRVG